MPTVLNVSAYLFTQLPDVRLLSDRVRAAASVAGLKGTVLLAEEGINLFLAGAPAPLRNFIEQLRSDPCLAALRSTESWSAAVPFRKLRVKCKGEIIRMNRPTVRPALGRAEGVGAETVARWLDRGHDDAGRPVLMLDTRNDFEVELGRFRGALDLGLRQFSDFPAAALARREALAGKTVVSYCTGGIRCEKAAIFLADAGVEQVVQLDGGVLNYFAAVGQRHFEGHCFVFDERVAIDAGCTEHTR